MLRGASVLLVLTVAACGSASADGRPQSSQIPSTAFPRTTSTSESEGVPWQPTPTEPAPEVKIAAVRALEAVLTYDKGGGTTEAASRRAMSLGLPAQLGVDIAPLLVPAAAGAVQVVYPQLGGLTPSAASVMAVTRIVVSDDGDVRATTRTIDVRLERGATGWGASSIASLGQAPSAWSAVMPTCRVPGAAPARSVVVLPTPSDDMSSA